MGQMAVKWLTMPFLLRRKPAPWDRAIFVLEGIQESLNAIQGTVADFEFPPAGPVSDIEDPGIAALQRKVEDLTTALGDGILRVQRSENRVRAIVQGARKELADAGFQHAGVEAEAGELHEVDGGNGEPEPVPVVPVDVADNYAASPIPGITVGEFRRAFSRRR